MQHNTPKEEDEAPDACDGCGNQFAEIFLMDSGYSYCDNCIKAYYDFDESSE